MLTRRQFFQSLAASVVAAGLPLPVGFPKASAVTPSQEDFLWVQVDRPWHYERSKPEGNGYARMTKQEFREKRATAFMNWWQ